MSYNFLNQWNKKMPDNILTVNFSNELKQISSFISHSVFRKIINKLTDYSEILTDGKLSGLVNYSYNFNSSQTRMIIDVLLNIQAIQKINNIALKGLKDLEEEYISNVFSDTDDIAGISSYLSIKRILENRLTHQLQQYNNNMGKKNTSLAIPINELKGHVQSFKDLKNNNYTISTKLQHGYIAASLHDSYIIILNDSDWLTDKNYTKFFFNTSDDMEELLCTGDPISSLADINKNVEIVIDALEKIKIVQAEEVSSSNADTGISLSEEKDRNKSKFQDKISDAFNSKMMMTPFGRQYGERINKIIAGIFNKDNNEISSLSEDDFTVNILNLYNIFINTPNRLDVFAQDINNASVFLIYSDYNLKEFSAKFLFSDKKGLFSKFYTESEKNRIKDFLLSIFSIYFHEEFKTLFKIVRSGDMKKFACAFIIKRLYLIYGENLSHFSYIFIQAIGRIGKIKG